MENTNPNSAVPPRDGMAIATAFIRPFLGWVDSGALFRRPFQWLYAVLAVLNVLGIVGGIIAMFQGGGMAGFLGGLVLVITFWVGFQIWWDRMGKVGKLVEQGADFVALPVFSHLFQTAGEWMGAFVAIGGALGSLVMGLSGSGGGMMGMGGNPLSEIMFAFGNTPLVGVIAAPIMGFVIIVVSRALAEQLRALVAIANNTQRTADNTRRG